MFQLGPEWADCWCFTCSGSHLVWGFINIDYCVSQAAIEKHLSPWESCRQPALVRRAALCKHSLLCSVWNVTPQVSVFKGVCCSFPHPSLLVPVGNHVARWHLKVDLCSLLVLSFPNWSCHRCSFSTFQPCMTFGRVLVWVQMWGWHTPLPRLRRLRGGGLCPTWKPAVPKDIE